VNCERSQLSSCDLRRTSASPHTHTIMHEYNRSHLMCDRAHSGKKHHSLSPATPPQATTLAPTSPHFPYPPIFPPTLTLTYQPLHSQAFTHFVNSFVFNNYNMLVQIVVVLCCWVSYVLQGVGNILVWFFTTWFDSCLPSVRPNS
jgi:hypothetical protein